MRRYKINLANQLAYYDLSGEKAQYFTVRMSKDKRVRNGKRNVLVIEKLEKGNTIEYRYKVNKNGSIEIPKHIIRTITHDTNGNLKFSMISAIDDKARKIVVPWLDSKGNF